MAMLALMREEQARARRLEHRLYAREREYKTRRKVSTELEDDELMGSQKRTRSKKNKQETKEKRADNGNEEEDIESMGQKFMAFLKARSDAQTDSG
jgi:hypothetical protein